MTLPTASTVRWQPLRTGLVDLFYYDHQEFWFRDGRILFRGNNGTGKSKVLALTMPLLLDGDFTPSRVEPDGDRAKKMEWNLLLGGRYDERLGYTFLEFGRVDERGERSYLTIGIGIKAVTGKGIADRWFFLTSQRVGQDLHLIGPSGTTLTHDRLVEAIGARGQVTKVADHYRRMIDEQLFHLGADRYGSLINLLIQLRQPQLSKKPDENKLSRALSDALTPVDQAVLSDIAAAFHDLEQQRSELSALRSTSREVTRFVERYRTYAKVAARRTGGDLRRAHSVYEDAGREIAEVGRLIAAAETEEREISQTLTARGVEQAEQTAIKEELTTDPKLKNLADTERYAAKAATIARAAEATATKATAFRDTRKDRRDEAAKRARQTRRNVDPRPAEEHADRAGLRADHDQALSALALPDGPYDEERLQATAHAVQAFTDSRSTAIEQLTDLIGKVAKEEAELRELRVRHSDAEGDRDEAADQLDEAKQAAEEKAEQHIGDWRAYRRTLTVLELPDPDETTLADWARSLDGPHPMQIALRVAATTAERALASEITATEAQKLAAETERTARTARKTELENGVVEHPPLPHTRGESARLGPGAAFWQVIDFVPDLSEADRAGLEAALEAAGLLDAWITPAGVIVDGDDTLLIPGPPVSDSLANALTPSIEPGCDVPEETVSRVLASIGFGERDGAVWVSPDGRWRLGPAHGSWSKGNASFIGHAAREERRRREIAELTGQISELSGAVERLEDRLRALADRQAALTAELARDPKDQALRDAHSDVGSATRVLTRLQTRFDRLIEEIGFKQDDLKAAIAVRDGTAADLRLPTDTAALDEVSSAVSSYREALNALLFSARTHAASLLSLNEAEADLAAAEEERAARLREAEDAARQAAEEKSRYETLREAIGASVEELRARLAAAITRLGALEKEIDSLTARQEAARSRRDRAQGRSETLAEKLSDATARRDAAATELQRFADTGLLALACDVALPDSWATTNAVEVARRAEERLKDVDDGNESWQRAQDSVSRRFTELSEALSRLGHTATAGLGDWLVVSIQFQGRELPPAELADRLNGDIEYRERLLSAKERDLLEEHLVNDVAVHLQQLITDADEQVRDMNAELADRPTSTGMRLRLRWTPSKDGPEGLPEARKRLLRQDPELWSSEDRAAVGAFLHSLIENERAKDEHGTWQDHLSKALDYRNWHRFGIERFQDGDWRPGTGPASGGERVLTVSLPLFAAAASQYRSAHPHAPRLVALDEAFAGVDDDARAKCLGLLSTFELDVVMTSEREWGFYPTVPGLAAHHLVRHDGIDAVHVTHWEWDGKVPTKRGENHTGDDPGDEPPSTEGLF